MNVWYDELNFFLHFLYDLVCNDGEKEIVGKYCTSPVACQQQIRHQNKFCLQTLIYLQKT